MFSRFQTIPKDELTLGRLWRALRRRIQAVPDHLTWELARIRGEPSVFCLQLFKDIHRGKRCFIMGNGPSLANMDLAPLKNEISIGLNRIYKNFDRMGFTPSYLICMNELVLEQSAAEISGLELPRFLNWNRRNLFPNSEQIYFLHEVYRPQFSRDVSTKVWGGATVTYTAMQVAYYLGVEEVILIGVDHSFSQKGIPHQTVISSGGDKNHFDEEYFPEGFLWQLPDLRTSEFAYQQARETFESDGRRILDATVEGNLTVFPKVDYEDLI